MPTLLIDFGELKKTSPELHHLICHALNVQHESGVHEVDLGYFPPSLEREIVQWREAQKLRNGPPPPQREEPEVFKIDPEETARQRKREEDEAKGLARLKEYETERGLVDCRHNGEAIREFLEGHPQIRGIITPDTIDAAISHLGPKGQNILQWAQPKPVTPPPPSEPVETLEWVRDKDGQPTTERELPLDSREAVLRKASIAQIKNLLARRRKASGQLYIRRGHASAF